MIKNIVPSGAHASPTLELRERNHNFRHFISFSILASDELCFNPAFTVIVFRQIGQLGAVELFHIDLVKLDEKGGLGFIFWDSG